MKNSNDTIGNRTRDLPACSAVPQQTAPPRTPIEIQYDILNIIFGEHLNTRFQWEGSVLLLLTSVILTLRRLMSYIYMEHPFLMFLDHTQRRSTFGRTPLDE